MRCLKPAEESQLEKGSSDAEKALADCGESDMQYMSVENLSMATKQIIAISFNPGAKIIIMDEATSALTQKVDHLFSVSRILKAKIATLFVSHKLSEYSRFQKTSQ